MAEVHQHGGEGSGFRFDFLGERLCLDFVNTVSGQRLVAPIERLQSYADLLAWAVQRGVLTEREAKVLERESGREAGKAQRVFARALALREALFRIFTAVLEQRPAEAEDLGLFNEELSKALVHRRVVPTEEGYRAGWDETPALDRMLWPVVEDVAELLSEPALERVKICEATATTGCGWLFFDTTKSNTRRWCSMKDCGNREKARRHYARVKKRKDARDE